MRSFWKPSLLLSCSALMLTAPLPAFAAEPDTQVFIGGLDKRTSVYKTVYKVDVTLGNAGNIPPPAYVVASLNVSQGTYPPTPICNTGISGINLPPGTSFKAFRFQVTYPVPIPPQDQPGTPLHKIEAEVKYLNNPCSQFETHCVNNRKYVTYRFPPGGTPSCVKLVQ